MLTSGFSGAKIDSLLITSADAIVHACLIRIRKADLQNGLCRAGREASLPGVNQSPEN